MLKGKALRRALASKDCDRVLHNLPAITDSTELITPERAHEMLRQNKHNRPTNWHRVEEYSDAMTRGEWKLTPQGIVFDRDGNLLNGQNRLWAVVYSGASVHMRVSRGSDSNVANVIDRGSPQSARDLATRQTGNKHSPGEANIARALLAIDGILRPSVDQMAFKIAENSEVTSHILKASAGTKKTKGAWMILAAICFRYRDIEHAVAATKNIDLFESKLCTELTPLAPDRCWGKGGAFLLAMEKAKSIVLTQQH